MRVAAVVVWFNPCAIQGENSPVENILSYAGHVEKVYIVDNSSADNSSLASKIQNSVYISNKNVNGIAGALNKGCGAAKNDGFEWVLTMDQDSCFDQEQLSGYLKTCEKYSVDDKCVSFSLKHKKDNEQLSFMHWISKNITKPIRFKVLSPIKRKLLHITNLPPAGTECKCGTEPVGCTWEIITSANLVKLDAWEKVGGYDEILFIDLVDVDFTYKLHLAGYKILKFPWLYFHHNLGEPKKTFFAKKTPMESDFRMRYIFRNLLILKDRYPDLDCITLYLKRYIVDYCILNLKGLKHAKIYRKARNEYLDMKKAELV